MFEAAPTIESAGGVSDDFGTSLVKGVLRRYCRLFDVSFQELFDTVEMKAICVQVDVPAAVPRFHICTD